MEWGFDLHMCFVFCVRCDAIVPDEGIKGGVVRFGFENLPDY